MDLHVRTLRIATGTHFLSFVTGSDAYWPTLREELERLPRSGDLVINVDGLDTAGALAVAAVLRESGRAGECRGQIIIVSEQASSRPLFRLWGLDRHVLIEPSLDGALRHVLARAWLGLFAYAGRASNGV